MNKWVCSAMRHLFTKEELIDGYVCEEDSKSKFKQMDPDRIKMLKEALFIKYKVKSQEQAKIWKSMKSVAGRVCIDTRNKSKQKNDKQNQASASLLSDE